MQCVENTTPPQRQGRHESRMDSNPLGENKEHESPPPPLMPVEPVMPYDGAQDNYFYSHWQEQEHASQYEREGWGHQQPPFLQPQFVDPLSASGHGNIYPRPTYQQLAYHHFYHQPPSMHAPPMAHGQMNVDPSYGGRPTSHARPHAAYDSRGSPAGYGPADAPYRTFNSHGSGFDSHGSGGSADALGSSARRRRDRRRQRRGDDSQHVGVGGGGGAPPPSPNRGRYDDTTLYQIQGRVVEIVKERGGSRFVQRRLQVADHSEIKIVFEESLGEIEDLWNHVYGNYILQGLLEFGTDDMRDAIGQKILDSGVVALSTKLYGCRLVQKALDTFKKEDVANIVASMKGKVCLLVRDRNGNHVIQKSVTTINKFLNQSPDREEDDPLERSLETIVGEVTENIKDLSVHCFGCRLVQRLIENCAGEHKAKVLDSVVRDDLCGTLINDDYGNYVVQCLLLHGRPSDRAVVFDAITDKNVLKLSKQKHSSNVMEKMLAHGDDAQRTAIVEEIVNCHCVDQNSATKSAVVAMAEDAYANYVLQTALDILEEGPTRERLLEVLLPSLPDLEESRFAKQVISRVRESRIVP